MESPHVLSPYLSESCYLELKSYILKVGKDLQIPWCIGQDFAQSESGPKSAKELFHLGVLGFCPENGGEILSIDTMMKAILQVRRLVCTPQKTFPPIVIVPLEFVDTVFKLQNLNDYSEDSWTVFQDFLQTKWPQDESKTMLDVLPSFPLENKKSSLIFCTGTEDNHLIFNVAKANVEHNGENELITITAEIYDSNPVGAETSQQVVDRRKRVLTYISLFSYLKGVRNKTGQIPTDYRFPGQNWQDFIDFKFKGCSLNDRMTSCQLGGSCYLHGTYQMLKHIMGPSFLLPPLNEMEQLLFGGLVNLHLLRTGRICTSYSEFLFKEKETMKEWRKCLHIGVATKLDNVTQDPSFFANVVKGIQESCETSCPSKQVLNTEMDLNAFYYQIVVPSCKHPRKITQPIKSFHFWISLFTSTAMKRIKRTENAIENANIHTLEPGRGILWYEAQVHDPIIWNYILGFQHKITTNTYRKSPFDFREPDVNPLKRVSVFPVIKDNFLAIIVFALCYTTSGDAMKMTLLVFDSDFFSVEERKLLIDYIVEEKIKKCLNLCASLNLQDFVVQFVRFSKPIVWQDQCCGQDEEEKSCRVWEIASNLSVLYGFSRFEHTLFTQHIPHPRDPSHGLLYGCEYFHRLKSLENQVAVISEMCPFALALALIEYFDND